MDLPVLELDNLRLATFSNFPVIPGHHGHEGITPKKLAAAGFCYLGEGDKVSCFKCQKTYQDWKPYDSPQDIHMQISPECEFIRRMKNNVNITHVLPWSNQNTINDSTSKATEEPQRGLNSFIENMYYINSSPWQISNKRKGSQFIDKNTVKKKAMTVLKRKKMYDNHRDNSIQQCLNLEQHNCNIQNIEDTKIPYIDELDDSENISAVKCRIGHYETLCGDTFDIHLESGKPEKNPKNKQADISYNQRQGENTKDTLEPVRARQTDNKAKDQELNDCYVKIRSLEEENKNLTDRQTCKVCMDEPVEIVFLPCCHLAVCENCTAKLLPRKKCPICRTVIKDRVKVIFIS